MIDLGGLYTRIEADTSGLQNAESEITSFAKKAAAVLAGIFAVDQIKDYTQQITMMTGRFDTLGVVMNVVGQNAGFTADQMARYQQNLEDAGISMLKSRETVTRMTQANIDLSKSYELARVAQNAAVIGNIDSSEAFQRMIYGIQSAQVEILRTIGLNVNFENSYKRLAAELGKTTAELTEHEKVQARTNVVLEAGQRILGAYEGAMDTPMKQWLSLNRHISNTQVLMGRVTQQSFGVVVREITEGLKDFQDELDQQKLQEWGAELATITKNTIDGTKAVVGFMVEYKDELITLTTVLGAAKGAQILLNMAVRANPYVMAATALYVLNEELSKFNMGLGDAKNKLMDAFPYMEKMWEGLSGKRDFHTGELLDPLNELEKKIKDVKSKLASLPAIHLQPGAHLGESLKKELEKLEKKRDEILASRRNKQNRNADWLLQNEYVEPWLAAFRQASKASKDQGPIETERDRMRMLNVLITSYNDKAKEAVRAASEWNSSTEQTIRGITQLNDQYASVGMGQFSSYVYQYSKALEEGKATINEYQKALSEVEGQLSTTSEKYSEVSAQIEEIREKLAANKVGDSLEDENKLRSLISTQKSLGEELEQLKENRDALTASEQLAIRTVEQLTQANKEAARVTGLRQAYSRIGAYTKDIYREMMASAYEEYENFIALTGDKEAAYRMFAQQIRQIELSSQDDQWVKGFKYGFEDILRSADNTGEAIASSLTSAFDSSLDAFVKFTTGAEVSFSDLARSIIQDLLKIAIREQAVSAFSFIGSALGSFFGGGGGAGPGGYLLDGAGSSFIAAKGMSFPGSTGMSAYSNSIVNYPTVVPLAAGAALIGEKAGSDGEGVLPLTRMGNGNLGVEAQFSSPQAPLQIINNIHVESGGSDGDEENSQKIAEDISIALEERIRGVLITEMRYGGVLYNKGDQ